MNTVSGSPQVVVRRALAAAVLVATAVACSSSDTAGPATTDTTGTSGTSATSDVTTSTAATTTTTVTPTTSSSSTTSTVATTTTTLPATTTTTEPLAIQELLLRTDGLGSARFGAEPEGVIDYVTSILGGSTADTGWVDPFTFADCGFGGLATVARRVDWGVMSLLFSDASMYATERRHFIGYEYGRVGQIGEEPQGLRTPGGVTLGSRVVDLLAEFPEASINPGEEDLGIPDNFYVSDVFYGLLTGTTTEDVVTVVFGGNGCGE
ncbi:MAG: hypothetical protein ACLGHQ_15580 [Acidimicrobiia bacterium]